MQTNEVKSSQVKTKAKKFLAVNKYHPLFLYVAFLAIVVLFVILITAVLENLVFLIFLILVALAIFIFMGGVIYSVSEFYLRSYNLKYEEKFSLFEGYKKENFARATLVHLIKAGIGLLGLVLLIAPGVIFLLRTSMTSFILRDNPEMSAWDAIKESNNLLKGHHVQYFKFFASFIAWFLLGIISFGGVLIYVVPYYCTSKSIFYHNILLELNDDDLYILYSYKTNSDSVSKERVVNDEILSIERKIKEMQRAKAIAIEAEKLNLANIKANAELEYQKEISQKPLLLEKVENIENLLDVEEIPLPEIHPNQILDANKKRFSHSGDTFATSEIEIMEGETFDDFRKRVTNLRELNELEKKKKRQQGKFVQSIYNESDKAHLQNKNTNSKDGKKVTEVSDKEGTQVNDNKVNLDRQPTAANEVAAKAVSEKANESKIIADKLAAEKIAKLESEKLSSDRKSRDLELGFAKQKLDVKIYEENEEEVISQKTAPKPSPISTPSKTVKNSINKDDIEVKDIIEEPESFDEIFDNNLNKNNSNHIKNAAYSRSGAYNNSAEIGATRGDIKKLTRTELIEKLRKDREAKNK